MSTPDPTPTLTLMELYAATEQRKAVLAQEAEQLTALQKSLAERLAARLDPEDANAKFAHTFTNGITVVVGKKTTERWVTVDGQSDEFWSWVHTNHLAQQFTTRTLKQEGVDLWREAHRTALMPDGELPPFIKQMTTVTPHVGVKGVTKPSKTPTA